MTSCRRLSFWRVCYFRGLVNVPVYGTVSHAKQGTRDVLLVPLGEQVSLTGSDGIC